MSYVKEIVTASSAVWAQFMNVLDWIVLCLTSPPTQYRLYGRRFLQVKRPNQQYQSTEGSYKREILGTRRLTECGNWPSNTSKWRCQILLETIIISNWNSPVEIHQNPPSHTRTYIPFGQPMCNMLVFLLCCKHIHRTKIIVNKILSRFPSV